MYIRKTKRVYKGKIYTNHLLVESVSTPKGPRQRMLCSLGRLEPAPREQWLALARKMEAALQGQLSLQGQGAEVETLLQRAHKGRKRSQRSEGIFGQSGIISIDTDGVETEQHREAGPVHVGHQIWRQLGLGEILGRAGLSDRACMLSEVMTLNRLVFPLSELSMPDWIRRTAIGDILGTDFSELSEDALYRNLDRLYPKREQIEKEMAEREKTLFDLDDTVYLYDLTSTYFEGQAEANPQAKRGYSRDKRPDCKQVLVGLVLDRDGFPKAHEIFEGNRQDRTTVDEMLQILEKRTGKHPGATVVVDRGMAYEENLEQIRAHGLHYLVAGRQSERNEWLDDFEEEADWEEVIRMPSPRNPLQKKSRVEIKRRQKGSEVYILCLSEGREEKDRAIRGRQEERLIKDLERLKRRIETGHLRKAEKIHQAIGRLQERYPRVARYYHIQYQVQPQSLSWQEDIEKKAMAEKLDGSYVLRTDRQDLTADEIWRTYMLLTRVEAAFRSMKSPLMERPIFHHLKHRTQTHIFLCVLAYHLLAAIEKRFLDQGIHTSWWSIRQQLSTHQVATIVLPTSNGMVLRIRKGGAPEPEQRKIYEILKIPSQVMKPIKSWHEMKHSD
ncbi:MAG: IS1634 family transposase [Deltaproteobacteria bacterium]|nr:IS1634 family transposase [Deltaproteobacteria bacterium]MDP3016489.1 IS1634 family transposase [Deltaproteobacteria bacterium]